MIQQRFEKLFYSDRFNLTNVFEGCLYFDSTVDRSDRVLEGVLFSDDIMQIGYFVVRMKHTASTSIGGAVVVGGAMRISCMCVLYVLCVFTGLFLSEPCRSLSP